MTSIEKVSYRNHLIEISIDDYPENPRTEWDNMGTMVCFHTRYDLGDSHDIEHGDFENWEEMEAYLKEELEAVLVLPLYLFDHSGVSMSTEPFGCSFDSGQVGFIYATMADAKEYFDQDDPPSHYLESMKKVLESSVSVYNSYLTGEVYSYAIEGKDCEDSCCGYYGETSALLEDAKQAIDASIRQEELPLG